VVPSRYLTDILPLILHRHLIMVLFHDHFDEATTFSGSQNTDSSMSFNLRQLVVPSRYLTDILPLILHRHLVMVLFHDQFDEATTFSGSQNTNSSMSFNLRQLGFADN
jgi:hypothetical protein